MVHDWRSMYVDTNTERNGRHVILRFVDEDGQSHEYRLNGMNVNWLIYDGSFCFSRRIYKQYYGNVSLNERRNKMKRISKGRPNCAILDKRYKVFPFFFYIFQ